MSLDIKKQLEENPLDIVFPEDVFSEYAKEIAESTNNIVIISINPYDGLLCSYTYNPLSSILNPVFGAMEHNIQDDLGVIGNSYSNKFEFLIKSEYLPDFSFRLFLAGSELGGYPCKIVMEQGFAELINKDTKNTGYIYIVNNSNELRMLLIKVFQSEKFITLIKQIISATKRKQKFEDKSAHGESKS